MICCYIRSSAVGSLEMCEMKYSLIYNFGFKDKQNKKATLGTIVHRALQVLGDASIAKRNGKRKVINDDIPSYTLKQCDDTDTVTKHCFDYYVEQYPEIEFDPADLRLCQRWVKKAIAHEDGKLDPRNQHVIITEKFFEIELDKPWAKYSHVVGDKVIEGNLILRGTIDLVIKEDEDYYQVLDYKSGKRLNWATGKEKTYECFHKDFQLLLYYYVMRTLHPDHRFYVSIFYINDGGVYDIVFDDYDYQRAEDMIRQKFEYIKTVKIPQQISSDNSHWKCQKLCKFSEPHESGKTICQFMRGEIVSLGYEKALAKHGNLSKLNKYSDGGGRIADD